MRETKLCEIEAKVIEYEPVKVKLREVISSIAYTLFCGVCAYAFTDYAIVVSHKAFDYVASAISYIALISGICLSIANIRDYLKSK